MDSPQSLFALPCSQTQNRNVHRDRDHDADLQRVQESTTLGLTTNHAAGSPSDPGFKWNNVRYAALADLLEAKSRAAKPGNPEALELAELPDRSGTGPQWHVSVSRLGKRPRPADVRAALTGEKQPIPKGHRWADLAAPRMEGTELEKHYRDKLEPQDLADPALAIEVHTALDELARILGMPGLYDL